MMILEAITQISIALSQQPDLTALAWLGLRRSSDQTEGARLDLKPAAGWDVVTSSSIRTNDS